jgi:hexosaminidase
MWGDDGAECSIYTALYGMQLYVEYNYSETPLETLDEMFKSCTGFDGEAFRL